MKKLKLQRLPKKWDESPKGCWNSHPFSREICQLPPDGHKIHKRKHPNGIELECWSDDSDGSRDAVHLEDVDFNNMDPVQMINHLKSRNRPNLAPLIRWIARGHAYDKSNHMARIAIADGEREAEKIVKEGVKG